MQLTMGYEIGSRNELGRAHLGLAFGVCRVSIELILGNPLHQGPSRVCKQNVSPKPTGPRAAGMTLTGFHASWDILCVAE
jgi:hypothetical protein